MPRFTIRGWFLIALAAACLGAMAPADAQFIPPQPQAPIMPQSQQYQFQSQQSVGGRCSTPAGICLLSTVGPVGTRCGCTTPRGIVSGQIVR